MSDGWPAPGFPYCVQDFAPVSIESSFPAFSLNCINHVRQFLRGSSYDNRVVHVAEVVEFPIAGIEACEFVGDALFMIHLRTMLKRMGNKIHP